MASRKPEKNEPGVKNIIIIGQLGNIAQSHDT